MIDEMNIYRFKVKSWYHAAFAYDEITKMYLKSNDENIIRLVDARELEKILSEIKDEVKDE